MKITLDELEAWDRFAAAALAGLNTNPSWDEMRWEKLCNTAAIAADILIAERRKRFPAEPEKSDDGWIEWSGGKCPVPGAALVDVEMRDGTIGSGYANGFRWKHYGDLGDIIRYQK